MLKNRFTKSFIWAFLAIFVTFGTAGAWEYTNKDSPSPGEKKATKAPAKNHAVAKEEAGKSDEKGEDKAKEAHAAPATHEVIAVSPEEALHKLVEGNKQYVAGKFSSAHSTKTRRAETAKAQHPFAVILSCSDSRVPPEIIFNQGIGDLFIVRTAGNISDDIVVGSIEYAVEHLGVRLIMVLGHERCGAVTAAVQGGEAPGHIVKVVEAIKPAVEKAKERPGELLENAIKANAKMVAQNLAASKPFLSEMFEDGVLKIVGAYYDLDSGAVLLTYNPK